MAYLGSAQNINGKGDQEWKCLKDLEKEVFLFLTS